MKVYADSARAEADYADRLRKAGVRRSPVDGLPVSLKDLFDVAGDVTRAGSKILERIAGKARCAGASRGCAPPARSSSAAPTWSSSRSAASGLNPHYGTPQNPVGPRRPARVPGGSSSGARGGAGRRHVRDGARLGHARLDSQARRRCAAWPASSPPRAACRARARFRFPSRSIRSVRSPIRSPAAPPTTRCSPARARRPLPPLPAKGLRLLLPRSSALDDLDTEVDGALSSARSRRLSSAGAALERGPVPAFDRQAEYFKGGGFAGAEAYHIHVR